MSDSPSPIPLAAQTISEPVAVEGPSFPKTVKLLASAIVVGMVGALGAAAPDALNSMRKDPGSGLFILSALGVVLAGYVGILKSRTRFDGVLIEQSWLWRKQVAVRDITQVKLIHLRWLSWIIVPRLLVRTGSVGLTTFHAADPQVLAAFRRLAYGEDL